MVVTAVVLVITVACMAWFIRDARKLRKGFRTTADYFLWGDEDLSVGRFAGTFAASNVTFTSSFLAVAATGYLLGGEVIWLVGAFLAGLLLFGFFYKYTIGRWVAGGQVGSMHEFLEKSYGRNARRIGALNTVVSFVGTIGLELLGVQLILESLAPTAPPSWLVLAGFCLLTVLIIWYTTVGGFREVVQSDVKQLLLIAVGIGALTIAFVAALARDSALRLAFFSSARAEFLPPPADPVFMASMAILFLPFQFCLMDMWQRCRATRAHPENVRKAILLSTPFATVPLLIAAALGVFLRHITLPMSAPSQENLAFFSAVEVVFGSLNSWGALIPMIALVALGVALLMAAVSTVDTLLSSIVYTAMIDLWADRGRDPRPESLRVLQLPLTETIHLIGGISVIVGVVGVVLTVFRWSLYDMALAIFGAQVSFALPLALAFFWPRMANKVRPVVAWALAAGLLTPIAAVLGGRLFGVPDLVAGAPLLAFVVVALILVGGFATAVLRSRRN